MAQKNFKHVGRLVSNNRDLACISQISLANDLGYKSAQIISNIERGLQSVPMEKMGECCKILKINPVFMKQAVLNDKKEYLDTLL